MPTQITRIVLRFLPVVALCTLPLTGLVAGTSTTESKDKDATQKILNDITPLNEFSAETSYVGESTFRIRRFQGEGPLNTQSSYGHQDEVQSHIEYAHRFHLVDKIYLKLGAEYERFDFGATAAPLPTTLQSAAGVVALEYMVRGKSAVFITSSPGVYFSDVDDVGLGNFDAPTSIGGIVPLFHNFYLLLGVHASILAHNPVLPFAGVVWLINDNLRLEAIPPEPRLIFSVSDKLDLFVGGEVLGNAYKRDETTYKQRGEKRFSGGVIDYSEIRAGGGISYSPIKRMDIDLSGGWDFGRDFNYYRGDSKRFVTEGAPYAKVKVSASF